MKFANAERVERKLLSVDQHIREAEEYRARGIGDVTEAQVRGLRQVKREVVNHEKLQADNKDYIYNRNRRREQRKLPQKMLDAVGGEL